MAFQRSAGRKRDFCFQCAETVTVRAPPHNTRRLAFGPALPFTTKQASNSSTDHGGGKQRRRVSHYCLLLAAVGGAGRTSPHGSDFFFSASLNLPKRVVSKVKNIVCGPAIVLRHTEFPRVSATSALGQKRTLRNVQSMSTLPPKADIVERRWRSGSPRS